MFWSTNMSIYGGYQFNEKIMWNKTLYFSPFPLLSGKLTSFLQSICGITEHVLCTQCLGSLNVTSAPLLPHRKYYDPFKHLNICKRQNIRFKIIEFIVIELSEDHMDVLWFVTSFCHGWGTEGEYLSIWTTRGTLPPSGKLCFRIPFVLNSYFWFINGNNNTY